MEDVLPVEAQSPNALYGVDLTRQVLDRVYDQLNIQSGVFGRFVGLDQDVERSKPCSKRGAAR